MSRQVRPGSSASLIYLRSFELTRSPTDLLKRHLSSDSPIRFSSSKQASYSLTIYAQVWSAGDPYLLWHRWLISLKTVRKFRVACHSIQTCKAYSDRLLSRHYRAICQRRRTLETKHLKWFVVRPRLPYPSRSLDYQQFPSWRQYSRKKTEDLKIRQRGRETWDCLQ